MDIEEKKLFDKTIEEKEVDFIKKYKNNPTYLKIPLWIFQDLVENLKQIKIDYLSGRILYEGLYICETPTIEKIEEIEVF